MYVDTQILYDRLLKNMQSQMDLQAGMRANKQKLQKGKLIVTDVQATQAVKCGKYSLHNGLLYHTSHTGSNKVATNELLEL